MKKILYLASPYSHPDPEVMKERCRESQKAAAHLMQEGYVVFAPIAQSHGIADFMPESMRRSHEFWLGQDLPILSRCDALVVLKLPGWEDSLGMKLDISYARAAKIPVIHRNPEDAAR